MKFYSLRGRFSVKLPLLGIMCPCLISEPKMWLHVMIVYYYYQISAVLIINPGDIPDMYSKLNSMVEVQEEKMLQNGLVSVIVFSQGRHKKSGIYDWLGRDPVRILQYHSIYV